MILVKAAPAAVPPKPVWKFQASILVLCAHVELHFYCAIYSDRKAFTNRSQYDNTEEVSVDVPRKSDLAMLSDSTLMLTTPHAHLMVRSPPFARLCGYWTSMTRLCCEQGELVSVQLVVLHTPLKPGLTSACLPAPGIERQSRWSSSPDLSKSKWGRRCCSARGNVKD